MPHLITPVKPGLGTYSNCDDQSGAGGFLVLFHPFRGLKWQSLSSQAAVRLMCAAAEAPCLLGPPREQLTGAQGVAAGALVLKASTAALP